MSPLVHLASGSLWGLPIMKFTLTYDGPLPASANSSKTKDVWRIRKDFHPQLLDLWENHPALKGCMKRFPRRARAIITGQHHSHSDTPPGASGPTPAEYIELSAPIEKHGTQFLPLVRETYALHCGLAIIFLRQEPPGRVYQGGDLDGRIKTLLDALAMPQHSEQVLSDNEAPAPIHCLMEDDGMASSIEVRSERLLTGTNHPKDFVRLIIEVDVRVRLATAYNQSFLG